MSEAVIQEALRYGVNTIGALQLVAVVGFLGYEYHGLPTAKRSLKELLRTRIIRLWVIMSVFNAMNCACSIDHYIYMPDVSGLAKCFLNLGYFGGYAVSGVLYLLGVYYRCDPILTSHPWKSKFYRMTLFTNTMVASSCSIMIIAGFAYGSPEWRPFVWNVFPCLAGIALCVLCLAYGYIFLDYFRQANVLGANKPANYDRCRHIAYWGNVSAACLLTGGTVYAVRFLLVNLSIPDLILSFLYHVFVTLGMISQLLMRKKSIPGQATTKDTIAKDSRAAPSSVTTKVSEMSADGAQQRPHPDLEANRKN